MKEHTLWRKISRIVMLLASTLHISPERALDIFYRSRTCARLHDERYGLHLMSDQYIVNDLIQELQELQ